MPTTPFSRLFIPVALVAALALPVSALAGGGKRMSEACRADVTRLCPDAEGCDRKACLRAHRSELSEQCSADIAAHKQRKTAVKAACAPDVSRLCGESDARRATRTCLRAHRDELSAPCADAISAMRAERGKS